jgi:hypothetical protein
LPDFDNCELWQKSPAQAGYQGRHRRKYNPELSEWGGRFFNTALVFCWQCFIILKTKNGELEDG